MSWILLASSSVLFFTTLNLLQRVLATESKDQKAMTIIFNSIAALISLVVFIIGGAYKTFVLPTEPRAYILLFVAMLFYGLYERGRFVASKLLEASVLTTISTLSVLVAFVGAAFLYNEPMTPNKILGGLLIIGALAVVSFSKKVKEASAKGLLVGALISIVLGIGWMCDKAGATYFNTNTYNLLVWTLPLIIIIFPGIKISALKEEMKIASWKVFVLAAVNVFGYLLQLKAVTMADATRVIPIVQLSTLLTVFMGVVLLKERDHMFQKFIAGVMAVGGAILLI